MFANADKNEQMSRHNIKTPKPGFEVSFNYQNGEEFKGTVLGWSFEKKIILLQCKSQSKKQNLFDIVILKPDLVTNLKVLDECRELRYDSINTEKVLERMNKNQKIRRDQINLSKCDPSVKKLVEHLNNLFPAPVRFEDEKIIINNAVIDKPYHAENITINKNLKESQASGEKEYISKILDKFYSEINNNKA